MTTYRIASVTTGLLQGVPSAALVAAWEATDARELRAYLRTRTCDPSTQVWCIRPDRHFGYSDTATVELRPAV